MNDSNLNYESCNTALEELTTLLENGTVSEIQLSELKMKYPSCIEVIQDQYKLWGDLNLLDIPLPSHQMHSRFYKSLSELEEKEGIAKIRTVVTRTSSPNSDSRVISLWNSPWKWAIAASLFVVGILVGRGFSNNGQGAEMPLVANNDNPVSYLQYVNQGPAVSATDKLIAIQEIKQEANPSDKIIEALYQALINDPNINVRLTAIETLLHFADQPKAREYLIRAIPSQESALVQVTLADAMLLLEEKKSARAWEELLSSPDVEPDVKIHITETLETLL